MSKENVGNTIGTIGDMISEETKAEFESLPAGEDIAGEVSTESEGDEDSDQKISEKEQPKEEAKQSKKSRPSGWVPARKERPTIRLYPGMNKDGEYIPYKLCNTLVAGGVKGAIDNFVTNLFSQLIVQYENTDVAVQVWGDINNSWFGKCRFVERIPNLDLVDGVTTTLDTSYVDWLEGIHMAAISRIGMFKRSGANNIDSYEFLTGQRLPILIGIAVGAPTGISYKVGEYIQGMLISLEDMAGKTGVYIINIAEPSARITQNDMCGMKCFISTPTNEEQSNELFNDGRAKHGTLPKNYVWISDLTRDDEYSDTRLMVPEYTRDKISDIVDGKIHPNRCVFPKNKLKQIRLLHFQNKQ